MGRRSRGTGSVFRGKDGLWYGYVSLGINPQTGKRKRATVVRSTRKEVEDWLKQRLALANVYDTAMTVSEWVAAWLASVESSLKPRTLALYRLHCGHLTKKIGHLKLVQVRPEHIEALYADLRNRGLSGATVQGVHRTLRASFNDAVRRDRLAKNPVLSARPGRSDEAEVKPLSTDEAKAILEAAKGQRNSARWAIALSLGLRQGEALGLCWDDVDLEAGTLQIKRALQRVSWKHGCEPPCGLSARQCPKRRDGGLITVSPKSRSGRRMIAVPAPVLDELRRHRRRQAEERLAAGETWEQGPNGGWVFAQANGKPIDSGHDWKAWKDLLKKAGVRDARLHDARHSAATYLLIQGVDARTVMGMLGWSHVSMTTRYQHPVAELMQEAAQRVGDLLWGEQQG